MNNNSFLLLQFVVFRLRLTRQTSTPKLVIVLLYNIYMQLHDGHSYPGLFRRVAVDNKFARVKLGL
jgi:hypothetical protein